jgi:hypothetical protein
MDQIRNKMIIMFQMAFIIDSSKNNRNPMKSPTTIIPPNLLRALWLLKHLRKMKQRRERELFLRRSPKSKIKYRTYSTILKIK